MNRMLPIFKLILFIMLWMGINLLLILLWHFSGLLPLHELPREGLTMRLMRLGLSVVAMIGAILIANKLSKSWKPTYGSLGLSNLRVHSLRQGIMLGGALITICCLSIAATGTIRISFNHFSYLAVMWYVFLFILVSFSEEVLVRGYVFSYLQRHYSDAVAVLISSSAFVLLHLANDHINALAITNLLLCGVLLALCKLHYQNLWMPIGVHFSWNFLQGSVLGFPVSGKDIPSILSVDTYDYPILNGGSFGIEGSIFTVIVLSGAVLVLAYMQYVRSAYQAPTQKIFSNKISQAA